MSELFNDLKQGLEEAIAYDQRVFASYMGVSIKTVEAWEGGRTHPTGPVFRLLDILSSQEEKNIL